MVQMVAADYAQKISRLIQKEHIGSMTELVNRLSAISDYLGFVVRYPKLFQILVQEQRQRNRSEEGL